MPVTTSHSRPSGPFVSVLATAIGSIGFGVSVLSIWVLWFLPSSKPATPEVIVRKKADRSRRKSAPPKLELLSKPSSVPCSPIFFPPSTCTPTASPDKASIRHVYFLDSQANGKTRERRSTLPTRPLTPVKTHPARHAHSQSLDASPRSSSSTLVSIATFSPPLLETCDESPMEESDPYPPSRTRPASRLSKIVSIARRRTSKNDSDPSRGNESDSVSKQPTKIITNVPPTSLLFKNFSESPDSASAGSPASSRLSVRLTSKIASADLTSLESSSLTTTPITTPGRGIPALFSRKPRPTPTKANRTQPYDYPYFATPPRASAELPRRRDSKKGNPDVAASSEQEERGRSSSLAPPRALHKRRSASESWASGAVRVCVPIELASELGVLPQPVR